ncbi:MAG: signal peptidase I [Chloroflexi bacterium]|nr:signal peptidase I [Chloroflexota bacterium]
MSARSVEVGSDQGPAGAGTAGRRRLFSARMLVLLVLLAYSGLSVYSGSFLPLRLVNGESMEPALSSGDIVLLKGTRFSEIDIGDIIAYKVPEAAEAASGPTTILHRVQKTAARNGQRVLITKGDNSSTDPWPVTASQVEGKQALRIPALGKPVVMLTSPRGILFVSIAILISLLYIPAMVMFHTTVLRKPPSQQDNALEGPRGERLEQPGPGATIIDAVVQEDETFRPNEYVAEYVAYGNTGLAPNGPQLPTDLFFAKAEAAGSVSPIVEAVEELTREQEQIKESLVQLGESISEYAVHLKSHTGAVQSLARVAALLEGNIQRQTELMEREAD